MRRAFSLPTAQPIPATNTQQSTIRNTATRYFLAVLVIITVVMAVLTVPTQRAGESLRSVTTTPQRAKVPGYEREEFGRGWAILPGAPCSMRELTIAHSLAEMGSLDDAPTPASLAELCALEAAAAQGGHDEHSPPALEAVFGVDPYSGEIISPSPMHGAAIEIDHIIPLSAAWDLGAHSWDLATRVAFANDPVNLVAVSRSQNQSKSDQLPSEWLPEKRKSRCWYANRMADVAIRYGLPLPEEDVKMMRRQCLPVVF